MRKSRTFLAPFLLASVSSLRPLSFALAAACAAVPAAAQQPKHAPAARTRHAVAAPASAMPDLAPAAAAASTLDPSLRALADLGTGKTSQAVRVAQQRRVLLDAQGRVSALAELAPGASAASLEALGAEVTGVYGDVVAVRMPVERLAELGASRAVRRVQASRQTYRPRTLNSRAEIRADLVHAGQNLPRAVTGTGAVAGVVDSGVDLAHPDFWTAAGGSRFLAVRDDWPATDRVYTRAQIEGGSRAAATTAMADTFAHGTHVAGTLGGSGQANAAMKGIAPGADLVFVKTTFEDASILSGCNFVFTQARAQNKPAVCNLSLGGHAGPHDGTSAFDRAIANLVQPGYLVVAAAGNEGGMESIYGAPGAIHVGQQMTAGREARMMYWPQYLADLDEAILQG